MSEPKRKITLQVVMSIIALILTISGVIYAFGGRIATIEAKTEANEFGLNETKKTLKDSVDSLNNKVDGVAADTAWIKGALEGIGVKNKTK